jgi:hypothetical protein
MTKNKVLLVPFLLGFTAYGLPALAGEGHPAQVVEKYLIALKTDDFELAETDVSHLAVGESETVVTEDGRTIDILRTGDGLELYVDGVLQEMNLRESMHGEHPGMHREIEIICPDEDDCEPLVRISEEESVAHTNGGEKHVITREIRVECPDDNACSEETLWISEDGESIHLDDADGEVRVIRLHADHAGAASDGQDKKVIVIKRKAGSS